MASMAMAFGGLGLGLGSAPVVSGKTPSKAVVGIGLGPCSVSFAVPKKPCLRSSSSRNSVVVRAQQSGGTEIPVGRSGEHHPVQKVPFDVLPTGLKVSLELKKAEMMAKMDRLLEETVMATSNWTGVVQQPRIPWEIMESNTEWKLRFDMPGFTDSEIKVEVDGKNLFIHGEQKGMEGQDHLTQPIKHYYSNDNWFPLPDNIVKDNMKRKFQDGVLYISFPKIP